MNQPDQNRVKELFLGALKRDAESRDQWLVAQCGADADLLAEVRSLLEHDSPDKDLLEQPIDVAIGGIGSTVSPDSISKPDDFSFDTDSVDSKLFLSKLSEVGVLSDEELTSIGQSLSSGETNSDPRQLASELVQQGKLTEYQASALLKGQPDLLIDKYLILDLLDAGGMGMVFKAIHRPMNRMVAVKMIAQHLLASMDQVKRFQREVRVAATLEHPNVVRAYDADQTRGVYFLVMEYVRGENLSRIVGRDGPMSVERAVDCIRQAAMGLKYAHKRGVIHRDIKPGNLMLTEDGLVKVLDLGLANVDESFRLAQQSSLAVEDEVGPLHSGTDLTAAGTVLGTVSFMAPEQSLDAKQADARSDIYSLGCTLYFLLTGEAPFHGDTVFKVFLLHRDGKIPSIRSKRPDVPESVDLVCQKMLAKKPDDRHQTMTELLAAIDDCEISAPPSQRVGLKRKPAAETSDSLSATKPTVDVSPTPANEGPSWAGLATVAILVLLLLGGGYAWRQMNRTPETPKTSVAKAAQSDASTISIPAATSTPSYGLSFDGRDDYVEIPSITDFGTEPFTIEAFVTHQGKQKQTVLSSGATQMDIGWSASARNYFRPILEDSMGVGYWAGIGKSSQLTLDPGERRHLAFVFDGLNARGFIDGTLVTNELKHCGPDGNADQDKRSVTPVSKYPNEPTLIGRHIGPQFEMIGSFLNGTIDEVRISTSVRYTEDFTPVDHFEPDDNTLALYHFDEGKGEVLHDSSGNGHHGKIVGAQWVRLDEQQQMAHGNRALRFDAGMVKLPTFEWDDSNEVTWEATVSLDSDGPTSVIGQLNDAKWHFVLDRNRSSWVTKLMETAEPVRRDVSVARCRSKITPSDRYHLAVVASNGQLRLFVDGKLGVASELPPGFQFDPSGIIFGARWDSWQPHGTLDEIRFSNVARYTEDYTPVDRFEPDEHTIALYHCDESGSTLIDSSGNGYHVDLNESVTGDVSRITVYDEENMSAADLLATGEYEWRVVEQLTKGIDVHAAADMSADGLILVFSSRKRAGSYGGADLWMTTRDSIESEWSKAVNLGDLINTESSENAPTLTPDGLTLLFSRENKSGFETYVSTRTSVSAPWSEPERFKFDGNIPPDLTGDQRTVVLGYGDLSISRRSSKDAPWPNQAAIGPPVNSDAAESYGSITQDGRLLIFARSATPSYLDARSIWMATRAGWNASWSEPIAISSAWDLPTIGHPRILADGKSILFTGRQDEVRGDARNVYIARLVRKRPDEANMSAADLLATGDYEWRVVEKLPRKFYGEAAALSNDLRTIVVSRYFDSEGAKDLWTASRDSETGEWSDLVRLGWHINTDARDFIEWVSSDGCMMVWHASGDESNQAFVSRRNSIADSWQPRTEVKFAENKIPLSISYTTDGLACVATCGTGRGQFDLGLSRRSSIDEPWPSLKHFTQSTINSRASEAYPSLSDDGCTLLFRRRSNDHDSDQDVSWWIATRSGWEDEWQEPIQLQSITGIDNIVVARLLGDGRSLLVAEQPDNPDSRVWSICRLVRKQPRTESTASLYELLQSGDWEWSEPVDIGPSIGIESALVVLSPCVSFDGKELLFSSWVNGQSACNLFRCTRDSIDTEWSKLQPLPSLINSDASDGAPHLTEDGLTMFFSSDRERKKEAEIWISKRNSRVGAWGEPTKIDLGNPSGPRSEPCVTPNDLVLYHQHGGELLRSVRSAKDGAWSKPEPLQEKINAPGYQKEGPWLSADERVLIYSQRSRSFNDPLADQLQWFDLWICTRPSSDSKWGTPNRMAISSPRIDCNPHYCPADKTLYFGSGRSRSGNEVSLWKSQLVPKQR